MVRNAHNHPEHPHTKPSAEDEQRLQTAINAISVEIRESRFKLCFTSTSTVYGGKQVSTISPAFADVRKIRDRIAVHRKTEFPKGQDFDGVKYYMTHADFDLKLVVTLHPQLAKFIHGVLALAIDFTFKRVEGDMDEWEVVGFSERFKMRIPFASFYCNRKTTDAFKQLFTELFDAIYHVTGERFLLRPFYPDANCRIFVMDGEVAQVNGFGEFLAQYNSPTISGISESNSIGYVLYCLKTCIVHFNRCLDELNRADIPLSVIAELKKIIGYKTQEDVEKWHAYCRSVATVYVAVNDWYVNKDKPWYLPSINSFLSKIAPADYVITPNRLKHRRNSLCCPLSFGVYF
ncbi:hypothetical protein GGX14DRAFT_562822 [Mycena pura]|uniref:Uncharacterized protein n=1 Tax=Mycena pura TaxID=153505 RepID=A0AAD6VPG5_9AGAR|nr:hypothetical protein GGX14DRAFT_562822 [Mycena pura]